MVGKRIGTSVPEEVVELIIVRVPCIKTILRCTSVCKSWYALINSSPFVKSQMSLTAINNNDVNKLLLCEFDKLLQTLFPNIFNYHDDDGIEAFQDPYFAIQEEAFQIDVHDIDVENPQFNLLFEEYLHDIDIEALYDIDIEAFQEIVHDEAFQAPTFFALHDDGQDFQEYCKLVFPRCNLRQLHACNGLICYNTSDDPYCLYLWNPTIQREKKIPTPLPNLNNDNDAHRAVFNLWFDNKANDFRILRITYTAETCTVQVFSLATNSWRLITDYAPVTTSFLNTKTLLAYVNGTFYWSVLRGGNWMLISLDIENGMFRERLTRWTASMIYLTPSDHDDSLVILGYGDKDDFLSDSRRCSVFEVYNYSLDKFHKFDTNYAQRFDMLQPLGVRNNDELLLQNILHSELVSYSVESEKFRKIVPTTSCNLRRTTPFIQTLALLNDADATRIQSAPNN